MKNSRRKGQRGEASALANDAWQAFLDLVGLASQKGFTLKEQAKGAAIFEHPVSKVRIWGTLCDDNLPDDAQEVLRKFLK